MGEVAADARAVPRTRRRPSWWAGRTGSRTARWSWTQSQTPAPAPTRPAAGRRASRRCRRGGRPRSSGCRAGRPGRSGGRSSTGMLLAPRGRPRRAGRRPRRSGRPRSAAGPPGATIRVQRLPKPSKNRSTGTPGSTLSPPGRRIGRLAVGVEVEHEQHRAGSRHVEDELITDSNQHGPLSGHVRPWRRRAAPKS